MVQCQSSSAYSCGEQETMQSGWKHDRLKIPLNPFLDFYYSTWNTLERLAAKSDALLDHKRVRRIESKSVMGSWPAGCGHQWGKSVFATYNTFIICDTHGLKSWQAGYIEDGPPVQKRADLKRQIFTLFLPPSSSESQSNLFYNTWDYGKNLAYLKGKPGTSAQKRNKPGPLLLRLSVMISTAPLGQRKQHSKLRVWPQLSITQSPNSQRTSLETILLLRSLLPPWPFWPWLSDVIVCWAAAKISSSLSEATTKQRQGRGDMWWGRVSKYKTKPERIRKKEKEKKNEEKTKGPQRAESCPLQVQRHSVTVWQEWWERFLTQSHLIDCLLLIGTLRGLIVWRWREEGRIKKKASNGMILN